MRYLKNGEYLIAIDRIDCVDYSQIEDLILTAYYDNGLSFRIEGIDALESAMALRPSALEGKRLLWAKGAWHFHNLVGHPLMSILAILGLHRLAFVVHDGTVPRAKGKKR